MMKWRTSASRTSAAKVLSTSTKSIWKTFCCTNCRLNACSWPTALPPRVTTVYDLTMANYGPERGLNDDNRAAGYDEVKAYTPAWAEKITGVSRAHIIRTAREFADNADKTHGRSMIIVGAGLNHWFHLDMNYRGLINMLIFCGCVGQSGGGWAHYVGQKTASADRLAAAGVRP